MFFVARGDSSEVFDAIEEALDAVAPSIENGAEAGLPAAMDHRGNVRRRADGFDAPAEPVGVIRLVGEDDGVLAQPAQQLSGDRAIAGLTRRQDHFERPALGVGQSVNLGRQPAARAAHTAIRVAFFEFAAC